MVGFAEGLAIPTRPEPAGDVHFPVQHVLPQALEGPPVLPVACFEVVIGGAAASVHRTNGVALEPGARGEGSAAKRVDDSMSRAIQALVAVQEIAGQFQVTAL